MPLAPGTTLGPYEVGALLGKGGMGEVYRARDRRLDRDVALKIISDAVANDSSARARFEREAKAVAALSHPNILAIFDFSKDHDLWFTVTELLEGETLRDRLNRGRLSTAEAIDIARELTDGLGAAHQQGIVHRDLKPENVFLTKGGHVKILDFGLAMMKRPQLDDEKTDIMTTKEGQIIGTVSYMSPEQLQGNAVTPASDVFAVGCVLYESIAGHRPFRGDSGIDTIAAVLRDEPAVIEGELAPIVMRCLRKNPADRFRSATELRAALDRPRTERVPPPPATRVIVLPFRMMRRDDDLDFLSYSLPDAIVGSLAGINSIIVRSSLAASQYAAAPLDIGRIAAEQDVNAIVTGTILVSGGRLRVSAQLTEMPSAAVKWSHSTETSLDDIFGVQDELTRKIVRSVAGPLNDSDSRALRKDVPQNPAAYEFFLRANQQAHAPDGWLVARDLYRRSVEEDPNFAPAWARLGRTLWLIAKYTDEPGDNWTMSEDALRRAIELNPDLSAALRYYAEAQVEWGDTVDSLRRLIESVRKRPNDPELHMALAKALRYSGLLHESVEVFRRVRELDPHVPISLAHSFFMLGEYQNAHETIEKDIFYLRPLTLVMLGKEEKAKALLRETVLQSTDRQYRAYQDGLIAMLEGNREAALPALDTIVAHNRDPEAWFYQARAYARLGEVNRALDLLERLSRNFFPVSTFEHDPWLDPLRGSPRFAEILEAARARHEEAREVWNRGSSR